MPVNCLVKICLCVCMWVCISAVLSSDSATNSSITNLISQLLFYWWSSVIVSAQTIFSQVFLKFKHSRAFCCGLKWNSLRISTKPMDRYVTPPCVADRGTSVWQWHHLSIPGLVPMISLLQWNIGSIQIRTLAVLSTSVFAHALTGSMQVFHMLEIYEHTRHLIHTNAHFS